MADSPTRALRRSLAGRQHHFSVESLRGKLVRGVRD